MFYVYGLYDEREPFNFRYIGMTRNPKERLSGHLRSANDGDTSLRAQWITGVINAGSKIEMVVLETHEKLSMARSREIALMFQLSGDGYKLQNVLMHDQQAGICATYIHLTPSVSNELHEYINANKGMTKRGVIEAALRLYFDSFAMSLEEPQ